MTAFEKIYIATKYVEKGYGFDDLRYGDDLYHLSGEEKEQTLEDIFDYMDEYRELGRKQFSEKYPSAKTY